MVNLQLVWVLVRNVRKVVASQRKTRGRQPCGLTAMLWKKSAQSRLLARARAKSKESDVQWKVTCGKEGLGERVDFDIDGTRVVFVNVEFKARCSSGMNQEGPWTKPP